MYKKRIIKIAICILLAAGCLYTFQKIFSYKYVVGLRSVNSFYDLDTDCVDILFIGSSHVYAHVNPAQIWQDYGIKSYDLAADAQPIWNTYYFLEEAIKTQKPKLVAIELFTIADSYDFTSNEYAIRNTANLKFSSTKVEAVKNSVKNPEDYLNVLFAFPYYHSRYTELKAEDFKSMYGEEYWYSNNLGYYPLETTSSFEIANRYDNSVMETEITEKNKLYLDKIIDLCEEEEINLVFFVTPYPVITEEYYCKYEKVKEYVNSKGIPLLNHTMMYDEIGLDLECDYADAGHLNYIGSRKYTSFLMNDILCVYDIDEIKYSDNTAHSERWENNLKSWQVIENALKLRGCTNINEYFDMISEQNYIYIINFQGDYFAEEVLETLTGQKIEYKSFPDGGTFVFKDSECIYQSPSETADFLKEFPTATVKISERKVIINNTEYTNTPNGLTIFVYDTITQRFIDCVKFDTSLSCRGIHEYVGNVLNQ